MTKFSKSARKRRHSTRGGVIGDLVYIPGSPVMTLPELLKQAEVGLEEHGPGIHQTPVKPLNLSCDPFTTPTLIPDHEYDQDTRQWNKQDWRQLDACFTDERLYVAQSLGMPENSLADVDDVEIEGVVERFIQMMGGIEEIKKWGSLWDRCVDLSIFIASTDSLGRDSLETRVRALQKKQRAGNVAPPTPGERTPTPRLSAVPDFTPLTRRRPQPLALRLNPPVLMAGTPFSELASKQPQVPASLLAPRYSHLLEEAMSISQDAPKSAADAAQQSPVSDDAMTKSQQALKVNDRKSSQFGLPLPPPEVLEKPRGPIVTPIRPPAAKVLPPKAQVHLQHAPSPKKSAIPRPSKPQRLVKLNPAPMPLSPMPVQRNRRSSGGSVKDLVRNFEVLDQEAVKKPEIKRIKSVGNSGHLEGRRVWKP